MPPINRVLWYIYSRNFYQKGGNLTHFTQNDYPLFAAFVNQTPINLGAWIFQEIVRFRFNSRKTAHIPFPTFISVILFYHKIWYLGAPDSVRTPPPFGKNQLNYMKLTFEEEASGQSRAPSRSRASYARASQAQEAQSAPPTSQTTLPPDFDSRVKAIVDQAIATFTIKLEFEIGKLVHEVKRGNHAMVDEQDVMKGEMKEMKSKVEEVYDQCVDIDARLSTLMVTNGSLLEKVDKVLNHFHIGSTSGAGPSSQPQPQPPTEPIPPTEPVISAPSLEDDKGGEENQD